MRSRRLGPQVERFLVLQAATLLFLAVALPLSAQEGPPPTTKDVVVDTVHGTAIADPYR